MHNEFNYGVSHLSIGTCLDIASGKTKGIINVEATKRVELSWLAIKEIVHSNIPVYGINTGFGPLCETRISESDTSVLQNNLLALSACKRDLHAPQLIIVFYLVKQHLEHP